MSALSDRQARAASATTKAIEAHDVEAAALRKRLGELSAAKDAKLASIANELASATEGAARAIRKAAFAELVPRLASFSHEPTYFDARALSEIVLRLDAQALNEIGLPLADSILAHACAQVAIDENPAAVEAFVSDGVFACTLGDGIGATSASAMRVIRSGAGAAAVDPAIRRVVAAAAAQASSRRYGATKAHVSRWEIIKLGSGDALAAHDRTIEDAARASQPQSSNGWGVAGHAPLRLLPKGEQPFVAQGF